MPSSHRTRPLPLLFALAAAALLCGASEAAQADAPAPPAPKAAAEPAREVVVGPLAKAGPPAQGTPTEQSRPAPDQVLPDDLPETAIPVPPVMPTGVLIAWKPMVLQVRADSGGRSDSIVNQFSSDTFQPLRFLVRYTKLFDEKSPFVGRAEFEGGQFSSDPQTSFYGSIGSTGVDFTGRLLVGAATRVSPGFTVLGSLGLISRYQYGKANGGAPTTGTFGGASNLELEFRVHPVVTLSVFGEAGIAPFHYYTQPSLGELSDSSELRGRIQLSFDLSRYSALDVGFDITRWHTTLTKTTILNSTPDQPGQALILENRELALTLGLRWVL